jgi:hypothetical protein
MVLPIYFSFKIMKWKKQVYNNPRHKVSFWLEFGNLRRQRK